jgi:hypothetical protein
MRSRSAAAPEEKVIKLKKVSLGSHGEDDDKYEIPTFLRKPLE